MKRISFLMLLTFFVVCYTNLWAKNKDEVTKTISEKYSTQTDTKLSINNRYGKVHINTWEKNEITVDIVIKAVGKDKEAAQKILDQITVKYGQTGNLISYETIINDSKKGSWFSWSWDTLWGDDEKSFEINYTINMPKTNDLNLENRYGAIFLDNYNGVLELNLKYGSLKANKLLGNGTKNITISYSKGEIESVEKGNLDFRYSSGKVDEVGEITLENRYGSFVINKARKVKTNTKYGSFAAQTIDELTGEVAYSGCEIGELRKKLVMEIRYASGFQIDKITDRFELIDIEGSYNSVKLGFDPKTALDFRVDLKYGDFKNGLNNVNLNKLREENTSKYYEGSANGKGNLVDIRLSYGSVKFSN
jgi:hypothetical protein